MSHTVSPQRLPVGPGGGDWHLGEGWGQTIAIKNLAQTSIIPLAEQFVFEQCHCDYIRVCHAFVLASRVAPSLMHLAKYPLVERDGTCCPLLVRPFF